MPEFEKDPNELGVLWNKRSERGGDYMTGTIGDQRVVVFKNGKKRSDKSPDWRILKSIPKGEKPAEDDAPW